MSQVLMLYSWSRTRFCRSAREAWVYRAKRFWVIAAALLSVFGFPPGAAGFDLAATSVEHFNFVLGTQTFGASYHFTEEAPVLETARAISALGSNIVKFKLEQTQPSSRQTYQALTDIARNDPAIKTLIEMPFTYELIWTYPTSDRARLFDPSSLGTEYSELYDFTRYLLKTYSGSGKIFLLGNWEMDNHLTAGRTREPSAELVSNVTAWVNTRQRAVDDAKRETTHSDVEVYYYLELNLVWDAVAGKQRTANVVLPSANVDYVSYSAYDSLVPAPEQKLSLALDYLQAQLHPKSEITGKRVFIGEYGFPADRYSPQDQDALSRRVMRLGLTWGCPFVLYWEIYNNEIRDGRQRGFWLIDNQNRKQPVYLTLQQYYRSARNWVTQFLGERHRVPSPPEFDGAAVRWLQ
jgi:hypothetical protein